MMLDKDVEFATDFLKGPRTFHKSWKAPLGKTASARIDGRFIFEASSWMGSVVLRASIYEGNSLVYRNDFELLKGPVWTPPFQYAARTVEISQPLHIKAAEESVLELELHVTTSLGSLKGRVVEIKVEGTPGNPAP